MAVDTAALGQLTKAELIDAVKSSARSIANLKKRSDDVKLDIESRFNTAWTAGETTASAFGFGYARGRYGDRFDIQGAPIELVAGTVLHIAAMMGWVTAYASDAKNIGNGAFAAYCSAKGFELGREHAAAKAKPAQTAAAGALCGYERPAFGRPMNDYELAAQMARSAP